MWSWAQVPNQKTVLDEERAKFGVTINTTEAGTMLARVAYRLRSQGFGLLRKESGNRCPLPDGTFVSCDWLTHQPTGLGCDALVGSPDYDPPGNGPATPNWCQSWTAFDASRFVAVTTDPGGTTPPPITPPAEDLTGRVKALESLAENLRVIALGQATQLDAAAKQIVALTLQFETLQKSVTSLPNIVCEEQSLGTGRSWAHSHSVKVMVCRPK